MAKTYEPIASTTLGSDTDSVLFSSIGSSWTDLVIVVEGKVDGNEWNPAIRFNGDSATNYSVTKVRGNGTTVNSLRQSNNTYMNSGTYGNPTNQESIAFIQIMSYANTNVYKTVLISIATPGVSVGRDVGLWRSTSAITSVLISGSSLGAGQWVAGSTFSLYGIKAA